jgi:hypothetical protein
MILGWAGCSEDGDNGEETFDCVTEGEGVPAVENPEECCDGLSLIPPKQEQIGVQGICTEKCGNGTCDSETESSYNCPEDCD